LPYLRRLRRILDSVITTSAYVRNGRLDILATNRLGPGAVFPGMRKARPARESCPVCLPRPRAAEFHVEWDRQAADTAALLRAEAGRNPRDWAWSGLIRELSTRSEILRSWWAAHNVRFHRTGSGASTSRSSATLP
jgi:MmyB-like transcription regulator ligand binding domain